MVNEIFVEQLYSRKKTFKEYAAQAGIFLVTVVVAGGLFSLLWRMTNPLLRMISIFALMGTVYFGFKLFRKLNVEVEYIYLNGEMDVDKIVAKEERKRILTVKTEDFIRFGEYTPEAESIIENSGAKKRFDFRSNTGAKPYYAVFRHKTLGTVAMIFEPGEKILPDMQRRFELRK